VSPKKRNKKSQIKQAWWARGCDMFPPALKTLLIAGVAGLSFATTASATITIEAGNNPQPGEQNILLNQGTGTTVTGNTNMSGTLVDFSSSTGQTLVVNSSGQAFISTNSGNGLLTSINVSSPLNVFTDFIANPNNSGAFTVTVKANDGTFTHDFAGGTGQNFVTVLAANGETISSVAFTADNPSLGFNQFQQPRISGISAVPEPSTWAMMLLGFLGLAFAFRQSRRKVSFA
jgi:hypothetical protein